MIEEGAAVQVALAMAGVVGALIAICWTAVAGWALVRHLAGDDGYDDGE